MKTARPLPSVDYLRECFDADLSAGTLIWRIRPRAHFKTAAAHVIFNTQFAGKPALHSLSRAGYRNGTLGTMAAVKAHRVLWKMAHGVDPDEVDHINGDRADNRIENLRSVERAEQMKNVGRSRANTSGVVGVYRQKKNRNWVAKIKVAGKDVHLGCFVNFAEAAAARKRAQVQYGFHANHGREVFA